MDDQHPLGSRSAAPFRDMVGLATSELSKPQPHPPISPPQRGKRKGICRYFGSSSGCRSGDCCPFVHDLSSQHYPTAALQQASRRSQPSRPDHSSMITDLDSALQQRHPTGAQTRTPNISRVVDRPVPEAQIVDPREYQLSQLRRRFYPKEQNKDGSSLLSFRMRPSDPDFPFDMAALHCVLRIPVAYPNSGQPPILRVTNPDMERGYQINVEKGFDQIVSNAPTATLLTYMNTLDRQLESLLSSQKAETVKILTNAEKSLTTTIALREAPSIPKEKQPASSAAPQPVKPLLPSSYSPAEKEQARSRRDGELRQLEARLGRLPQFAKSADGLSFTVPIEPRKRTELPVELRAIKTVNLVVPELYSLEPCRLEFRAVAGEAVTTLQTTFKERVQQTPQMSLINHINYLSQNIHTMAKKKSVLNAQNNVGQHITQWFSSQTQPEIGTMQSSAPLLLSKADEKSHVFTIPRPPEWSILGNDGRNSDSSSSHSESEEEVDDVETPEPDLQQSPQTSGPEKGLAVDFPQIELYGIELMELASLSITVKCNRCKKTRDASNLRSNANAPRLMACTQCSNNFNIGYRMNLMHLNSMRAGYLDLDGCSIVDMLPSTFVPTCSGCSSPYVRTGVMSVRGETSMAFCRECHRKMTFRVPNVKFLQVSASNVRALQGPSRKKQPEKLGIVSGQQLPDRGRCDHYKKSYRWFRFSCCEKVYPCDRCHDKEAGHAIEHANRMICGFCSREQNYRPKDCGICHAWLTIRPGKGFWEGGQGTRDQTKMSRKDPRKYKRKPGTKPAS